MNEAIIIRWPDHLDDLDAKEIISNSSESMIIKGAPYESEGPWAAYEWIVPTTFVVTVTSLFFKSFLEEAGKDAYQMMKARLKEYIAKRREIKTQMVASAGSPNKLSKTYDQSFSISLKARLHTRILVNVMISEKVAWVAITPLLNNCVQWSDNYYLYAQMERVQPGSVVQITYQTAALPGQSYDFKPFGSFFPSDGGGGQPNAYKIVNLFTRQPYITLGMAQPVQVNGSLAMVNPINAVSAPSNTTMVFSADNQVTAFISNTITAGELLPGPLPANAFKIGFSLSTSEVNVIHDAETGGFVNAGL